MEYKPVPQVLPPNSSAHAELLLLTAPSHSSRMDLAASPILVPDFYHHHRRAHRSLTAPRLRRNNYAVRAPGANPDAVFWSYDDRDRLPAPWRQRWRPQQN